MCWFVFFKVRIWVGRGYVEGVWEKGGEFGWDMIKIVCIWVKLLEDKGSLFIKVNKIKFLFYVLYMK